MYVEGYKSMHEHINDAQLLSTWRACSISCLVLDPRPLVQEHEIPCELCCTLTDACAPLNWHTCNKKLWQTYQLTWECLGTSCLDWVLLILISLPLVLWQGSQKKKGKSLIISQFQQCPLPPPGAKPRALAFFFKKMGKFPGVGKHKLSKYPRGGDEERGQMPRPRDRRFPTPPQFFN